MNKNVKNIILIVLFIVVIAVILGVGYKVINKNENTIEEGNAINETSQNMGINVNNATENVVNETENNVIENNTTENKQEVNEVENKLNENTESNTQTTDKTEVMQESGASNEEKAINIVKKDWGTTDGIYFVTMGIDASGKYIVTVNDSNTTGTLAWYSVDVTTGKFSIQQ
ncbi:MAG TPA: hypothetical protein OIM35_00485 [Clostridiaceae bacterium]|nr:hypothetical protein [Clostridiaceae bacterium]